MQLLSGVFCFCESEVPRNVSPPIRHSRTGHGLRASPSRQVMPVAAEIVALEVVLLALEGAPRRVAVEAGLAVRRARGVLARHVVGDRDALDV